MELIPSNVKKLWDTWNIQVCILLSMSLQILLALLAPLRKRSGNTLLIMVIWSAYSAADWASNFVVGLITNSIVQTTTSPEKVDLLALWAPFLLLHLGGPDSITAFALEDNELWIRYLLSFIFQAAASAYIISLSLLPGKRLLLPTVLVFLAGTVKCLERLRPLYSASLDIFRESLYCEPDPGPNYFKAMRIFESKKEANLPVRIEVIPEPLRVTRLVASRRCSDLSDGEVLERAYSLFQNFKGLFVDLMFSIVERNYSRRLFLEGTARDAFKIVETELNFIYDVLYTRVNVLHSKGGSVRRSVAFISFWAALVSFCLIDKQRFDKSDVEITYALLIVGVVIDTTAIIMLVSSDWSLAALSNFSLCHRMIIIMGIKSRRWLALMGILKRRWCESVPQYNVLHYYLNQRSRIIDKLSDLFGLTKAFDQMKYVTRVPFVEELRNFIFNELRRKAEIASSLDIAKEIHSARGDRVLHDERLPDLLRWIIEADYDESILVWHLATELCYNSDHQGTGDDQDDDNIGNKVAVRYDSRELSRILSDYMAYLLVVRPTFTSTVTGIINVRDTRAEALEFFQGEKLEHKEACKQLLDVNTQIHPNLLKGNRSRSVLFDACILAKELNKLEDKQWVIISRVWLEMLCYAASRCRAYTHAQQLGKGGELLTFVWLLMAHFGFGEHYQLDKGYRATSNLVIGK